jgi:hypothetical protein
MFHEYQAVFEEFALLVAEKLKLLGGQAWELLLAWQEDLDAGWGIIRLD